jgi:hypothetical protein
MGMLETGQDVALTRKARFQTCLRASEHWQLEGHFALESAIGAPRQPYLRHAPSA